MNVPAPKLVAETIRALWSRPWWALVTVVFCVSLGVGFASLIVVETKTITERQERLMREGWGLVVVASAAGQELDARACIAARSVPGVVASGAVGRAQDVMALGLDAGVGLTSVTADVPRIVWPESDYSNVTAGLLTPGLQSVAGLGEGTLYVQVGGALVPLSVARLDGTGRYPMLDGGILVVRNEFDVAAYCLVDVPPELSESLALDIAAATLPYETIAIPAVSRADASPTPRDLVAQHNERGLPLIVGAFLLVVAGVRLMRSRRDRAVYRLLSFSRADLWIMGLIEYLLLLAIPLMSAFATTLLLGDAQGVATEVLGMRDAALLSLVSCVGGVLFASAYAAGRNTHQFAPGS